MITLKTLPEATAQEVFDQVARHLLAQNAKSRSADNFCAYRGADGLKCAAGCLIADDEYQPGFDFHQGAGSGWLRLGSSMLVPTTHQTLISDLQRVHDHFEPDEWRVFLGRVAEDYSLNSAVINEFPPAL